MGLKGLIPSKTKTFEVFGSFNEKELVEGKLYYDPKDLKVYYYSKIETRPNPKTGHFPVWDGKRKYQSSFSKEKYFDKDVIVCDIQTLSNGVNSDIAKNVLYMQERSNNEEILKPKISDEDNMFTQCIKGVIAAKEITIIDLVNNSTPKLPQKTIENYYSALNKIIYMRMDKWNIWINNILHVGYKIDVMKNDKIILSYKYPENIFDTGIVKYDNIISGDDDPFKKIIKIIMIMENITKSMLRSDEVDDYTINNMMTTITSKKPLSSQLFSRFMRMTNLSYKTTMYDGDKVIFEFKE